jgi:hypothetical protein
VHDPGFAFANRRSLSSGETAPPADRDRLSAMEDARRMLTQQTGLRFGGVEAWMAVKQRIDELLDDRDRLRLVRLLEEHPAAAADRR